MTSRKSASSDGHTATITAHFSSDATAALVATSLSQEVGEIDDDRAAATIDRDGDAVAVTVTATDLSALRAGLATWFSLLEVAASVASLESE